MAWWRRDPSLWCRSALHRYSRQAFRENEAALRSRCFSKSLPNQAQHQDDPEDKNRPAGITDLQWLQLQHFRRWKKRVQENPYRALFGASNDMLQGRGLKDWEWVHKRFPKWLVREMDFSKWPRREGGSGSKGEGVNDSTSQESYPWKRSSQNQERSSNHFSDESEYPKKVDIVDGSGSTPSTRARDYSRWERYQNAVASPSDPRRPSEPISEQDSRNVFETPAREDASARERDFIKEFFAESQKESTVPENKASEWRQTVLDRRSGQTPADRTDKRDMDFGSDGQAISEETLPSQSTNFSAKPPVDGPEKHSKSNVIYLTGVSSSPGETPTRESIENDHLPVSVDLSPMSNAGVAVENKIATPSMKTRGTSGGPNYGMSLDSIQSQTSPSTSKTLSQLPEDDLDLLSASDIRASMGNKKNLKTRSEEPSKSREDLERDYDATQKKGEELESMLEAVISKDQQIRQSEQDSMKQQESVQVVDTEPPKPAKTSESKPFEPALESSIDRMTRWLQIGSDVFAKHFWADPIQARESVRKAQRAGEEHADALRKMISSKVQKGGQALDQAAEIITVDLPWTKPLLERVKGDELKVKATVGRSFRAKPNQIESNSPEVNQKALRSKVSKLKNDISDTEAAYDKACLELDDAVLTHEHWSQVKLSKIQETRLRIASEILQKNARLTRMLIFAVQARYESLPQQPCEALFADVGYRLLALQDTQLALSRLVDRSIWSLGLRPSQAGVYANTLVNDTKVDVDTAVRVSELEHTPNESAEAKPTLADNPATKEKLEEEIKAQKSAMMGLSDDGYTRPPKAPKRKTFDEPSPLANSLFRPFRLSFENLGKDPETVGDEAGSSSSSASATAKKKTESKDKELVQEIKEVYEDTYGPITVHHHQDGGSLENAKAGSAESDRILELDAQKVDLDAVFSTKAIVENKTTTSSDGVEPSVATSKFEQDRIESVREDNTARSLETDTTAPVSTKVDVSTQTEAPSLLLNEDHFLDPVDSPTSQSSPSSVLTPSTPDSSSSPTSTSTPYSSPPRPISTLPTEYKIITHDASTDTLSITTTLEHVPSPYTSPVPIHIALTTLSSPAKFVPHIPSGYEIVSVKPDLLILREMDDPSQAPDIDHITLSPSAQTGKEQEHDVEMEKKTGWKRRGSVNPIDGTARLSPTGYAGLDLPVDDLATPSAVRTSEIPERLEQSYANEFTNSTESSGPYEWSETVTAGSEDPLVQSLKKENERLKRRVEMRLEEETERRREKGRGRGGVAKVMIVGIWGAVACYVVGVLGEVLR